MPTQVSECITLPNKFPFSCLMWLHRPLPKLSLPTSFDKSWTLERRQRLQQPKGQRSALARSETSRTRESVVKMHCSSRLLVLLSMLCKECLYLQLWFSPLWQMLRLLSKLHRLRLLIWVWLSVLLPTAHCRKAAATTGTNLTPQTLNYLLDKPLYNLPMSLLACTRIMASI